MGWWAQGFLFCFVLNCTYSFIFFCIYMYHNNNFKSFYLPALSPPAKAYFSHSPHSPEFWLKGKGDALESEQTGTPALHAQTKEM